MSDSAIKAKFHFLTEEQYDYLVDDILESAENNEDLIDAHNAAIRFLLIEGFDERFIRDNACLIDELIKFHTDDLMSV